MINSSADQHISTAKHSIFQKATIHPREHGQQEHTNCSSVLVGHCGTPSPESADGREKCLSRPQSLAVMFFKERLSSATVPVFFFVSAA